MLNTTRDSIVSRLLEDNLDYLVEYEELTEDTIIAAHSMGSMVILGNPAHKDVIPTLVGQPASIKVNANIGTSPLINDAQKEIKKLKLAENAGADTVMDLSTGGDLQAIRQEMLDASRLPLGTVPLYGVTHNCIKAGRDAADFTARELLDEIARQAEQGVDFVTVHCGVTRRAVEMVEKAGRTMGIVSRGGAITARYMKRTGNENPLYEHFDELCDIAVEHNLVLSLGDGMRPGAGVDAGDMAQWEEVIALGEMTLRAWDKGVQVMIEGPGHVPMNMVRTQIQGIKRICHNAPLYILGPLTTDCAPGYDHIAGAIGGAIAVEAGADYLCYLTPAEHLTLPSGEDVRAGVIASRIAAQAGEAAIGRASALRRDFEISKARADLDWEAMAELSLDPAMVRHRRDDHKDKEECAMCGEFCAVKMLRDC